MSLNFKQYEDLRFLIEDHGLCEVLRNISFIIEENGEDTDKIEKLYKLIEAAGEVC